MRVHVIGKNGYIASNLIPYLEGRGYGVRGVGRGESLYLPAGDICVNCVQYGGNPEQKDIYEMVISNFHVPSSLEGQGAHLIHLSSSSEIFEPHTAYARTKSLASDHLRGKATLCYIYTAWGGVNEPPHRFMAALLKAKKEWKPFFLTTPYATRDFVHIKHICRGIEELIHKPIGEYHFGTGNAKQMKQICDSVGLEYTSAKRHEMGPRWEDGAQVHYFPDTFEEDLKEELCTL